MKIRANIELLPKTILLLPFFVFLIFIPLPFIRNIHQSSISSSSSSSSRTEITKRSSSCDIFSGKWVRNPKGPYYNNETCNLIVDQQNCLKFGRPDREYLEWRWRPHECELPLFDATLFLKLVKGKSMAFVGDSVGMNQMNSLLCLLNTVSHPKELPPLRNTSDHKYFKHYFYADFNFTLLNLWSPYLVTSRDKTHIIQSYKAIMNLNVDEPDESWTTHIKTFDYVIISAGHWFFRPLMFHDHHGQIIGCHACNMKNTTELTNYYGYKMAFRTSFRTLLNLEGYKGVTILRTFSPSHFENGEWNKGGSCVRTTPFREMRRLEGYDLEMYLTQVVEFREAMKKGKKKGLKFWLMDLTELMMMRPDGHPNKFGHSKDGNVSVNDCVHWCVPGPIDTWNEFFLYMLKRDSQNQKSSSSML